MKIINNLNFLVLSLLILISGCGGNNEKISELDNPELIIIAFFDALYNEKDIEKAASVCTPALARVIRHYKSTQAVGRHVFNMSFDSVKITPDDNGVKVRKQYKNSAKITVYLDGTYNENKIKDVKRLALTQVGNKWVIDKLLKDPF